MQGKFGLIVIALFAAFLVAIGSRELQHRFASRTGSKDSRALVRELHGEVDFSRASLSRRPVKESDHPDEIDQKDRSELNKLLQKVVP